VKTSADKLADLERRAELGGGHLRIPDHLVSAGNLNRAPAVRQCDQRGLNVGKICGSVGHKCPYDECRKYALHPKGIFESILTKRINGVYLGINRGYMGI